MQMMNRGIWFFAVLMLMQPAYAGNDEKNGAQEKEHESIGVDVEIEGIAVINGRVYIDGVRIPEGRREVVSRKTGKVYRIDWGRDGNIAVTEK